MVAGIVALAQLVREAGSAGYSTGFSVLCSHAGMVLKFRTTEWPFVASRKSMVMGSMSEKSQEVLPFLGGSSAATPSFGYGSQGT